MDTLTCYTGTSNNSSTNVGGFDSELPSLLRRKNQSDMIFDKTVKLTSIKKIVNSPVKTLLCPLRNLVTDIPKEVREAGHLINL